MSLIWNWETARQRRCGRITAKRPIDDSTRCAYRNLLLSLAFLFVSWSGIWLECSECTLCMFRNFARRQRIAFLRMHFANAETFCFNSANWFQLAIIGIKANAGEICNRRFSPTIVNIFLAQLGERSFEYSLGALMAYSFHDERAANLMNKSEWTDRQCINWDGDVAKRFD